MNNLAIRRLLLGIAVLLFSIALTPLNDTIGCLLGLVGLGIAVVGYFSEDPQPRDRMDETSDEKDKSDPPEQ